MESGLVMGPLDVVSCVIDWVGIEQRVGDVRCFGYRQPVFNGTRCKEIGGHGGMIECRVEEESWQGKHWL